MPLEPPKDKPPPVKCRQCQSTNVTLMGKMEKSKESIYRCTKCGFVFTTPSTT